MVKFIEREYAVQNDEGNKLGEIRYNLEREVFMFDPYPGEINPNDMQKIAERVNKLNGKN